MGIVVLFTLVNSSGRVMGRAETVIVAIKVGVLLVFIAAGIFFVDPESTAPSGWDEPPTSSSAPGSCLSVTRDLD